MKTILLDNQLQQMRHIFSHGSNHCLYQWGRGVLDATLLLPRIENGHPSELKHYLRGYYEREAAIREEEYQRNSPSR